MASRWAKGENGDVSSALSGDASGDLWWSSLWFSPAMVMSNQKLWVLINLWQMDGISLWALVFFRGLVLFSFSGAL